jgi:hypothetical protein
MNLKASRSSMPMAPVGHSGRQAPRPSQYESEINLALSMIYGVIVTSADHYLEYKFKPSP